MSRPIVSRRFGEREIAALPAWAGTRQGALGDFFKVRGERSARVSASTGSVAHVNGLGAGMAGGDLVIDGDAGDRVGAGMTGGLVDVRGDVRDDAGRPWVAAFCACLATRAIVSARRRPARRRA